VDEEKFTELLSKIYQRHAPTMIHMAKGIHELKQHLTKLYAGREIDFSRTTHQTSNSTESLQNMLKYTKV
jgi:hypothetical protein